MRFEPDGRHAVARAYCAAGQLAGDGVAAAGRLAAVAGQRRARPSPCGASLLASSPVSSLWPAGFGTKSSPKEEQLDKSLVSHAQQLFS